ncbi:hypothetical protein PENTCL1PPCAC_13904 [Pristionchus entomophagus]|uniref:Uncharacterized protein n=1 Tax=Pristionchus entomophagus TaxID=358040 RepID=A0AAV5T8T8_9BILA|nr:hypothetical protein PENTCL1PPCAC_13904 [Pristionchus entomophagus]
MTRIPFELREAVLPHGLPFGQPQGVLQTLRFLVVDGVLLVHVTRDSSLLPVVERAARALRQLTPMHESVLAEIRVLRDDRLRAWTHGARHLALMAGSSGRTSLTGVGSRLLLAGTRIILIIDPTLTLLLLLPLLLLRVFLLPLRNQHGSTLWRG